MHCQVAAVGSGKLCTVMLRLVGQDRYALKCCGCWIRRDMHCNVAAVGSG